MSIIKLSLLIFALIAVCRSVDPTESYDNQLLLNGTADLKLFWKHTNETIVFEIHSKNAQWLIFGLSPPTASYSDVVFAWLKDDGLGHFSDSKLFSASNYSIDTVQNWLPLDAFKQDSYTVFKFTRKLRLLCDENSRLNEDLDIERGLNRILFARGNRIDLLNEKILIDANSLLYQSVRLLNDSKGPFNCAPKQPELKTDSPPTANFANEIDLMPGRYKLYWNYTDKDFIGEVHVRTLGWVGFGFSPNGGMANSDVMIAWIPAGGQTNFTDRFITPDFQVRIDAKQDWKLLYSTERNGFTIIRFTRPINLCDADDRKIDQGSPNLIFAFGSNDPQPGQDIAYHGPNNRGNFVTNLISLPKVDTVNESDDLTVTFNIKNVLLPKDDTYYYCKTFQIPTNLTNKRHIYQWEIMSSEVNIQNYHHMIVYECDTNAYNGETTYEPGDCKALEKCMGISLAWAYGGSMKQNFPKDTAYPIGGDTDYKYIVVEIHYNNPTQTLGYMENFNVVLHTTSKLRKNELGFLTVGNMARPSSMSIPPEMNSLALKTYCPNQCLRQKLANHNLTIVASIPHTHLTGVEVWTKIVRNNIDIGYLYRNKYYDFNFQNSYTLNPFVNITMDDELITFCRYKTMNRKNFTYAGLSTKEEMCFNFLTYYPRNRLFKNCISLPFIPDHLDLLNQLNTTGDIYSSSLEYANMEQYDKLIKTVLNKASVTQRLKDSFQSFYDNSRYSYICDTDFEYGPFNQTRPKNVFNDTEICVLNNPPSQNTIITFLMNLFRRVFGFLFR